MELNELCELGLSNEAAQKVLELHMRETEKIQTENKIEKELIKSGARNLKACRALIDEGRLKESSIEKQIKALKESEETGFLFLKDDRLPFKGALPQEESVRQEKQAKNMTYTEMCEYLKER